MFRNGKTGTPGLLLSPNSVLLRSVDLLRPRVLAARPSRIEFRTIRRYDRSCASLDCSAAYTVATYLA